MSSANDEKNGSGDVLYHIVNLHCSDKSVKNDTHHNSVNFDTDTI